MRLAKGILITLVPFLSEPNGAVKLMWSHKFKEKFNFSLYRIPTYAGSNISESRLRHIYSQTQTHRLTHAHIPLKVVLCQRRLSVTLVKQYRHCHKKTPLRIPKPDFFSLKKVIVKLPFVHFHTFKVKGEHFLYAFLRRVLDMFDVLYDEEKLFGNWCIEHSCWVNWIF